MQRAARQQATSGRTAHGRPRSPLSAAHARAAGYTPHRDHCIDRSHRNRPTDCVAEERRQPRVCGRLPRRAGACSARRAASARAPAAPDQCCGAAHGYPTGHTAAHHVDALLVVGDELVEADAEVRERRLPLRTEPNRAETPMVVSVDWRIITWQTLKPGPARPLKADRALLWARTHASARAHKKSGARAPWPTSRRTRAHTRCTLAPQ